MLYATPAVHIVYAAGSYEGPLFGRNLKAKCAFLMSSQYKRHADGRPLVLCQLDVFVRVENLGADLITKTLRPVAARMADYNFSESTQFISQISKASVNNGAGMQRLAHRMNSVDPNVQTQFARLTAAISDGQRVLADENTTAQPIGSSIQTAQKKEAVSAARRHPPQPSRRTRLVPRR